MMRKNEHFFEYDYHEMNEDDHGESSKNIGKTAKDKTTQLIIYHIEGTNP